MPNRLNCELPFRAPCLPAALGNALYKEWRYKSCSKSLHRL
jgi:hypothetical protein